MEHKALTEKLFQRALRRHFAVRNFFERLTMTKTEWEIYCVFGLNKVMQRMIRAGGLYDLDQMLKKYKVMRAENQAFMESKSEELKIIEDIARRIGGEKK